jgi:hypothetical protein
MQGRMPPPIESRLAAKQHVLVRARKMTTI